MGLYPDELKVLTKAPVYRIIYKEYFLINTKKEIPMRKKMGVLII